MNPLRSGFLFIELNARSALSAAQAARDFAPDLLSPKSQDILFEREAPWMFNGNGATNDPDLGHWRVKVWRHGLLND